MIDGRDAENRLEQLIDERLDVMHQLLEQTTQQEAAVGEGHMSQLMAVLSTKQRLVEQFVRLSQTLRAVRDSCPEPLALSDSVRSRHRQCDSLHAELLSRESACEKQLTSRRDDMADEMARSSNTRRAASGYGQSQLPPTGGNSLDLSSD
ncbi:MAG: flagellar biosynthesis protein FlgN [Planctomycetota bacterium]